MAETITEQAQRLHVEAVNLLAGNIAPSTTFARQMRLIDIGNWFAYNGAGSEGVRAVAPVVPYLNFERNYVNYKSDPVGAVQPQTIPATGRQLILQSMTKDPTKPWASETALWPALTNMVANDKHLPSVIAALKYMTAANIPVSQINPILGALQAFKTGLPGNTASAITRTEASLAASALESQIQSAQAQAATTALPGFPNANDPLAAEPHLPGRGAPIDWKPWAALGGAVVLLGSVVVWKRRRAAMPAPAPSLSGRRRYAR